jgi:hypothetical protein
LFTFTYLGGVRIWDVASGVALVQAAGLEVMTREDGRWLPFERFNPPATVKEDRAPTLRDWSRPLAIGRSTSLERFLETTRPPGMLESLRRLLVRRR